ncbi:hypothetical protein GDO81_003821 [Engystomops pustulosus]|uniref:VWFC domain-containing protein n=1 Tax=Engystomops pustulosus TaxID=76066 RepID=A0AAV7A442_ENGPU|nr:hypothetical protein GDO81_003821 [Engystomops pustulosus]
MNLLLSLLVFSTLVCTGWAQQSHGKSRLDLHQEVPKTSKLNLVDKRSSPIKKVPEQSTTRSRNGDAAATMGSPLVAGKGQCLVNGMIMYNGAAWSPQRCTICVCDQGRKVCEPLDCEEDITCPSGKLHKPPGECCPVCVKTETTQVPLDSAAALNQTTAQKNKEAKNNTKHMKVKGETARTTSRPALGLNTTANINTKTIKPTKKTPAVNRTFGVTRRKPPVKKEINHRKQETNIQKKGATLTKPKKEGIGEKNSDVEGLKTTQKEKTRNKTIKKGSSPIPGTEKPKTPILEITTKQEPIELMPPTPTMPSVPSFIRPTLHHIPSLPSGCLLSESTIACANTRMTYLPLMTDLGLKTLYLAENEISKLPARAFAGLPNLEWLDLSKNKLDDSGLSHDVFKNLTKLKRLNLDGNRLTALPQLPTSLQELKVNDNKLLELNQHSFRGLGNLLTLEMEGNGFHDGNVSPLTLRPLKKLIYLRLNRNHFRAVPSGLPASIQVCTFKFHL